MSPCFGSVSDERYPPTARDDQSLQRLTSFLPRGVLLWPQVTIPFRSFSGVTAPRSATIRLFGDTKIPLTAGDFDCPTGNGLTFSWAGDNSLGETVPLTFANQVNSKTLLLPPRSLTAFTISRFLFRVCYSANPVAGLCGVAETAFVATISSLVRTRHTSRSCFHALLGRKSA